MSLFQVISQVQTCAPDAVSLHVVDFQWKRKLSLTRAQSIVSGVRSSAPKTRTEPAVGNGHSAALEHIDIICVAIVSVESLLYTLLHRVSCLKVILFEKVYTFTGDQKYYFVERHSTFLNLVFKQKLK